MIQIWQVPSECGPSNLVVLGLSHKLTYQVWKKGAKNRKQYQSSKILWPLNSMRDKEVQLSNGEDKEIEDNMVGEIQEIVNHKHK